LACISNILEKTIFFYQKSNDCSIDLLGNSVYYKHWGDDMGDVLRKYTAHVAGLTGVECNIFDIRLKHFPEESFCCRHCANRCDCVNTHLYGCFEAQRWGFRYIYYCPSSFIFVAVPIVNEAGMIESGVVAGPIQMGEWEEDPILETVPELSTAQVNHLSEVLHRLFEDEKAENSFSGSSEVLMREIYQAINPELFACEYPIELEHALQLAIVQGDGSKTRELLNQLLGYIFFHSDNDFRLIKSRVVELIVLLSRSAIRGGAETALIFAQNDDYLRQIERFQTLEQLSVWLTGVIDQFVNYTFSFAEIKHTDTIHKAAAYIRDHCTEKLTVDEIANAVFLSKSYLSSIFRNEMKCNLTSYINLCRVERSKSLLRNGAMSLAEIASTVGFDDQSYFTKVFKKHAGMSPKKYRETGV